MKRNILNSVKGWDTWVRVQESSQYGAAGCPLLTESWSALSLPGMMSNNRHRALSTMCLLLHVPLEHWALVSMVFSGTWLCRHGWLTSVFNPSWGWADTMLPKACTTSHEAGLLVGCWAPDNQGHSYQWGHAMGYELASQELRAEARALIEQG